MTTEPAMIGHFDITGDDPEALVAFYGGLFDWQVTSRGPGYSQVKTPAMNGAIAEAPTAALTLGVIVNDLIAALARAKTLGGNIVMPATDNGWVKKGQVSDPAGNVLTLIQR